PKLNNSNQICCCYPVVMWETRRVFHITTNSVGVRFPSDEWGLSLLYIHAHALTMGPAIMIIIFIIRQEAKTSSRVILIHRCLVPMPLRLMLIRTLLNS